jgi:benzylsuccinate CoA-transferase BbsE subunit
MKMVFFAEVIKIEKPGGDPARNIGPFYHSTPHPERSLYWFAYNANKRGITLDIEKSDGQKIFKSLVENADCVVESFSPGYMHKLGLGYDDLKKTNQDIIMASVTPYGQEGFYHDYKASDLTVLAMGGFLYINGDSDRAPVAIGNPQARLQASADAALGIVMAYYSRLNSGEGQYIDVSMQQSIPVNLFYVLPFWEQLGIITGRYGPFRSGLGTGVVQRMVWPCKDGFVNATLHGGAVGARTNRALIEWMDSEGLVPNSLKEINWDEFDMATLTQEFQDLVSKHIMDFFLKHTKDKLYRGAMERRIMLYPVCSSKDLLNDTQLKARDFWEEVEHPELEEVITYPGAWAKPSEMNLQRIIRAPLIGEHNQEIYQEIGLSENELLVLKQGGII